MGPFQLLEYQWSKGKFDSHMTVINKPAATRTDASDNSMTEATSMGGADWNDKGPSTGCASLIVVKLLLE